MFAERIYRLDVCSRTVGIYELAGTRKLTMAEWWNHIGRWKFGPFLGDEWANCHD